MTDEPLQIYGRIDITEDASFVFVDDLKARLLQLRTEQDKELAFLNQRISEEKEANYKQYLIGRLNQLEGDISDIKKILAEVGKQ